MFQEYVAVRVIGGDAAQDWAILEAIKPYLDALYPLPNGEDLGDGTGEFLHSPSRRTDDNFFTVRVDHNFYPSDSFFARYTFDHGTRNDPTGVGIFWEQVEETVISPPWVDRISFLFV